MYNNFLNSRRNNMQIIELIKIIVWPITILLILLFFRNDIKEALKLMKKISLPGGISIEMEGKYGFTKAGELLAKFWKPDGENINPKNQKKLKDWMKGNGIDAPISFFNYNPQFFGEAQSKAVKDLNITE
jgi:hypothetical protein